MRRSADGVTIPMNPDQEKAALNARAKAAMQRYLKSKTWPEKIRSIERMNQAGRIAREAMRKARQKTAAHSGAD
jgi:hypothetical protein